MIHSQETHLQQWFGNDSRKLQSHEWKWKSFPNPLMGEHKMAIHNHCKLCTIVFEIWDLRVPYRAQKRISTSNCQVIVIVTIYKVVKVAEDDIAFKLAIFKKSLHFNDNAGFCSIIQASN